MALEMRPVAGDEMRAIVEVDGVAFGQPERTDSMLELAQALLEPERTHVVFDNGRPVAAAAALSWELTVAGGTLPAAAVTYVGVVTTHRRRGLLTNMMRAQLDDVRERGEPVAALLASESVIYGRFGYGMAVMTDSLEIDRTRARFARPVVDTGSLRLLSAEEGRKELPAIFERYRMIQPGEVSRSEGWWTQHFADPEWFRDGASAFFYVVHESRSGADGYASYRIRPTWREDGLASYTLEIYDLVAQTPDARTALWRYCLDVDLVSTVKHVNAPVDETLRWQLAEPRRLRVTRHGDFLWVRVLDVAGALSARAYSTAVDVVLAVDDPFFPELGGRFRLHGGPGGAECVPTDAAPDLTMTVADLGAAYLGGVRFSTLARARRVAEETPGALLRADAAFAADPLPYCSTDF